MIPLLNTLVMAVVYVGGSAELRDRMLQHTVLQEPGRRMVQLARQSLGRPYRAFSLDQAREQLRIDLTGFDCFLFVEQLLALAVEDTRGGFEQRVRQLRYQGGSIDYCTRQHYFSRWSQQAQASGLLQDITPDLPSSISRQRRLNFMSANQQSYAPLRQARNRDCIQELESNLVVQQSYIPLQRVAEVEPLLRDGDIFALVTRVSGLDVTHVGLVERSGPRVHAIHAAPGRGVMRSHQLSRYASGVDDVIGLSFHRPLQP
jgi:hypothetical protein